MDMYVCTYTHVCIRIYIYIKCVYVNIYIYTYIHTHLPTYIHAYINLVKGADDAASLKVVNAFGGRFRRKGVWGSKLQVSGIAFCKVWGPGSWGVGLRVYNPKP